MAARALRTNSRAAALASSSVSAKGTRTGCARRQSPAESRPGHVNGRKTASRKTSHFDHVFASVIGIADKPLPLRVDDQIHQLKRYLPNHHGKTIGNLGHVANAIAILN